MGPRPFRVAHIAVDDRRIYASDETLPVVAQVDRATGGLERLFWWPVSPEHRRRSASEALLPRGDDLWVSSPLSGGMVRVDTRTGAVSLIALDEAPGTITAVGDAIWVVGYIHADDEDAHGVRPRDFVPTRPIVWAEGSSPPELFEDYDDFSFHLPPGPVWRIDGEVATRVDLGGDVSHLTPVGHDEFMMVLRRLDDPVVMRSRGEGGVGFGYPGVVARGNGRAAPTVVVEVPETSGSLIADGDVWWLSGFGFEPPASEPVRSTSVFGGPDPVALFRLDVETGRLDAFPFTLEVETIVGGVGVVLQREHASRFGGRVTRCVAQCFALDRPGEPRRVELATNVDSIFKDVVTNEGKLWLIADAGDAIVWLDPTVGATGVLPLDADLAASMPAPVRPDGTDLASFEQAQLDGFRAGFLGEGRDDGEDEESDWISEGPLIRGIEFESVELHGEFPDTHVVLRFRADDRPGVRFARRFDLYDELGNTQDHEYAEMHLTEDIEAAGWGLPPLEECRPDAEGIVWF